MVSYKNLLSDINISKEMLDRTKWPTVNEESLEPKKRIIFINRKKAIDMYLNGEKTIDDICELYNLNSTDLYRLIKRCLEIDKNGRVFGYRALIPYFRIKSYSRKNMINGFDVIDEEGKKLSGAFQKFLDIYPNIREEIINLVLKRNNRNPSQPIPRGNDIHEKFIKLCREEGILPEKGDYPFNTKDLGQRSLYRYIKEIKLKNSHLSIKEYGKDAEMLYNNTGVGERNTIPERPFERVEFDGHKLDVVTAIRYTTLEGDEIVDIIDRMWLLMIVDCATRVILGYHIVLNKEYSAADVMTCIRNAIMPWSAKKIDIPGLKFYESGGFASELIPESQYAVWDEILFDNALANIAKSVETKLKKLVNCHVNTGPVGTPTRRPLIEKLFHILEENGFHRTVSTTGSNPKDPRRKNAEQKAIKYEITPNEIEQLVEVLIANRNGTPQKALNSLTPLETMQQRINRKMPFRLLNEEYQDGYEFLTIEEERFIRGKIGTGRRPYIHYEGVDYRNEILAEGFDLVGTKITIKVSIDDMRNIKAYLPDGSELGLLRATGKWSIRKHSLKIRKTINKLIAQGKIKILYEDDPVEVYHNYLRSKAKNNKGSRTQLAALEKMVNSEIVETQNSSLIVSVEHNKEPIPNLDKSPSNVLSINGKLEMNDSKKNTKVRERFFFNS
jgi:putative transposase